MRKDPHTERYAQTQMRQHLAQHFKEKKIIRFLNSDWKRRLGRHRTNRKLMQVQWKMWTPVGYHQKCLNIDQDIVNQPSAKFSSSTMFVDDVEFLCLIKECRNLEDIYRVNYTEPRGQLLHHQGDMEKSHSQRRPGTPAADCFRTQTSLQDCYFVGSWDHERDYTVRSPGLEERQKCTPWLITVSVFAGDMCW